MRTLCSRVNRKLESKNVPLWVFCRVTDGHFYIGMLRIPFSKPECIEDLSEEERHKLRQKCREPSLLGYRPSWLFGVPACMDFIRYELEKRPLGCPGTLLLQLCEKEGFTRITYRRARTDMGLTKTFNPLCKGSPKQWEVSLSDRINVEFL
jgi:hypothetical protein